jgi:predicted HD superfamily hydrolase involved in NAD metabolism
LAIHHQEDLHKTKIACLLHDVCKLDSLEKIKETIATHFPALDENDFPEVTWHALAGMIYAKEVCHITDPDILNAIKYHTTGRPNMSKLEKIVCLSDYIEEGREFVSDELRKLAFIDLDKALYVSMLEVSAYLHANNLPLSRLTLIAMEDYKSIYGGIR